jgi:hypothetical protein
VDWDKLLTNKASIVPTFVPNLRGLDDTDYFDNDRKWSLGNLTFMDGDATAIADMTDVRFCVVCEEKFLIFSLFFRMSLKIFLL